MKFDLSKLFRAGIAGAIVALAASSAQAVPYAFSQGGFSGGGSLTGFFIGDDLDNSGYISEDELSAFGLSFTGDSFVSDLYHSLSDLMWFKYTIGGSTMSGTDYIASDADSQGLPGAVGFYLGGDLAAMMFSDIVATGFAQDYGSDLFSYSTEAINVAVPEPATWVLIGGGLEALGLRRRWTN